MRPGGVARERPSCATLRRVRSAVLVGALALMSCAGTEMPPSASGPALGRALPEFTRRSLAGPVISSTQLRGKIVVVEFFAKYCAPCWQALPQVQKLAAGERDVVVIGVGEDEFASDTQGMARELGLSFPVVHDAGNALAGRFRVGQLPATLVIDRAGVVRWQARPQDGVAALRRVVAALRAEDG